MQRSVEQKHAPNRGQRKRRDPRLREPTQSQEIRQQRGVTMSFLTRRFA